MTEVLSRSPSCSISFSYFYLATLSFIPLYSSSDFLPLLFRNILSLAIYSDLLDHALVYTLSIPSSEEISPALS